MVTAADNASSQRQFLTSCSDDRTIAVWDVSDIGRHDLRTSATVLDLLSDPESLIDRKAAKEIVEYSDQRLVATTFGHASRIWDAKVIKATPYVLYILSVGEDATTQLWEVSIGAETPTLGGVSGIIKHQTTFAFNSGRNIWPAAVSFIHDTALDVLVGGADARIVKYSLVLVPEKNRNGHTMVNSDHYLTFEEEDSSPDFIRDFGFLSAEKIIATTNNGLVLLAHIQDKPDVSEYGLRWQKVGQLSDLKSHSKVRCVPQRGLTFMAGLSGTVYVHDSFKGKLTSIAKVDGKVADIFVQNVDGSSVSLLVTKVRSAKNYFYLLYQTESGELQIQSDYAIELSLNQVVTSTLCIFDKGRDIILLLGGRDGSIMLLNVPLVNRGGLVSKNLKIQYRLENVHKGESVTALLTSKTIETGKGGHNVSVHWLFSTGRDGNLTVHKIQGISAVEKVMLVHRNGFPFGPHIEGLFKDRVTDNLLIYGFRSTQFVLYDLRRDQELFTVECGGAHRRWVYSPPTVSSSGVLAWTKSSVLNIQRFGAKSHEVLQVGGHGREIKAVAAMPSERCHDFEQPLIATGAEDTTIKLFEYLGDDGLESVQILKKHVTGIQHLLWSPDGRLLLSSGGFQEFYVWSIQKVPLVHAGVNCESKCPLDNPDFESRITDFCISASHPGKDGDFANDPAMYTIVMVYSDSLIRICTYDSGSNLWSQLQTLSYQQCCLTQVCAMTISNQFFLVTSATNGNVAYWPFLKCADKDAYTKSSLGTDGLSIGHADRTRYIQQNAITCMKSLAISSSVTILGSGGDDGSLAFTLCWIRSRFAKNDTAYKMPVTSVSSRICDAHAASVKGLEFVYFHDNALYGCGADDNVELFVISVGNDQRLKLWEIGIGYFKQEVTIIKVRCVTDVFTQVADVSALAMWRGKDKLISSIVTGTGIDIHRLTKP